MYFDMHVSPHFCDASRTGQFCGKNGISRNDRVPAGPTAAMGRSTKNMDIRGFGSRVFEMPCTSKAMIVGKGASLIWNTVSA